MKGWRRNWKRGMGIRNEQNALYIVYIYEKFSKIKVFRNVARFRYYYEYLNVFKIKLQHYWASYKQIIVSDRS